MYGVNIMKVYEILVLMFCLAFALAAGDDEQEAGETAEESAVYDSVMIEKSFHEYIDRVKVGDLTVLYENEFSYYTDEHSYDDYMAQKRVHDYKYDTLAGAAIDSMEIMGDSTVLSITVFYASAEGDTTSHPYVIRMYRSFDRWVRPYMSKYSEEVQYLEDIKAYQEAVSGKKED